MEEIACRLMHETLLSRIVDMLENEKTELEVLINIALDTGVITASESEELHARYCRKDVISYEADEEEQHERRLSARRS